ncbi:SMI1/KNR4 family protein [Bacillus sp. E(2018)]|uniref:SMI1/KNR4 family protein n=1 Tax=Bacillus sp. E(2018) TaxID=2502239 RepID=UPI0010F51AD7|nr:SMI1/KNR4 family protein [Bacillus sp. E(2018)]
MKIKQDTIVRPLPSEEMIKNHEKFWRISLPVSFLEFIKENNGVEVEEATIKCNNRDYAIERFLCVLDDIENHPKGIYDIDVVYSKIGERLTDNEDLLGAEVLPIASVFAGDYICLDFRKDKNNPSVCLWSHEESSEFEPITYNVADNVAELLKMI